MLPAKSVESEIDYWWTLHLGFITEEDMKVKLFYLFINNNFFKIFIFYYHNFITNINTTKPKKLN